MSDPFESPLPDPGLFESFLENIANDMPQGCRFVIKRQPIEEIVYYEITATINCLDDSYLDSLEALQRLQLLLVASALESGGQVTLPGYTEITSDIKISSVNNPFNNNLKILQLNFSCSFLID